MERVTPYGRRQTFNQKKTPLLAIGFRSDFIFAVNVSPDGYLQAVCKF
jgi:hypothetical protein